MVLSKSQSIATYLSFTLLFKACIPLPMSSEFLKMLSAESLLSEKRLSVRGLLLC